MEGVLIRSKTRWMEQGKKPSKYFLNMEKRNCVNRSISRVVTDNNSVLTSSCSVLNEARLFFYKKLYSSSDTNDRANLQHLFSIYDSAVLSNLTRDRLEGPLSYQEILNALKRSKNGKSPGSDGFSFEIFKFFF